MKINFTLNQQRVTVDVNPLQSLLQTLRDELQQTSVKQGCGEGECGACSVLLNGQLVNSCLVATMQVDGAELMTLEGLKQTDKGRCVIDALLEAKGVQCGFCSPGMVMALYALLEDNPRPDESAIRSALSGNLCRCTGYGMIVEAAQLAAQQGAELWHVPQPGGAEQNGAGPGGSKQDGSRQGERVC